MVLPVIIIIELKIVIRGNLRVSDKLSVLTNLLLKIVEKLKKRKMIYLSEKRLFMLNKREKDFLNRSNCTIILYTKNGENIGFLSHWIQVYIFLKSIFKLLF